MNPHPQNFPLQQRLQSTESSLLILQQRLSQLPTQSEELSATLAELSLIKSELQSVLETLSRLQEQLISRLCHEFFTPLTLIQGTLQLLAAEKLSSFSEATPLLLKVATDQTHKLIQIVKELLIYQQIKSGQLRILPQPCPVVELVQQAAQIIQLKGKPLTVSLSVKPVLVSVWAEPFYIILVLSHLLSNAIKFSPRNQSVSVRATLRESEESAQFVLFQVQDQGIGISSDQLQKIFSDFYQVERSDSRSYNGLGLGLALSHRIVQLHGGQLWAESSLGAGSNFCFTLPVHLDPSARQWWLEIHTEKPQCTYYFGPFETANEARSLQEGYLEDLKQEQARGITVTLKLDHPEQLTICGSTELE